MRNLSLSGLLVFLLLTACTPKVDTALIKLDAQNFIESFLSEINQGHSGAIEAMFVPDSASVLIMPGFESPNNTELSHVLDAFYRHYQEPELQINDLQLYLAEPSGKLIWFTAMLSFDYESEGFDGSMDGIPFSGLIQRKGDGTLKFLQLHLSLAVPQ